MPRYRAKEPGFFNGTTYGPRGKRPIVYTDKPLNPVPSWLEKMEDEKPAQRQKRQAKTAAEKKAEAERLEAERIEKDAVTFTEPNRHNTETL